MSRGETAASASLPQQIEELIRSVDRLRMLLSAEAINNQMLERRAASGIRPSPELADLEGEKALALCGDISEQIRGKSGITRKGRSLAEALEAAGHNSSDLLLFLHRIDG